MSPYAGFLVYSGNRFRDRGLVSPMPVVEVQTVFRLYAIWYDLEPGPARLLAESRRAVLPAQGLELEAGGVQHLLAQLEERPVTVPADRGR